MYYFSFPTIILRIEAEVTAINFLTRKLPNNLCDGGQRLTKVSRTLHNVLLTGVSSMNCRITVPSFGQIHTSEARNH